jgi:hypothetical protein
MRKQNQNYYSQVFAMQALLSVPVELREALDGVAERLVQAFPTTKIVKRTKRERHDLFGA